MMGKAYVLCVAVHGLSLLLLGCGASLPRSRPNRVFHGASFNPEHARRILSQDCGIQVGATAESYTACQSLPQRSSQSPIDFLYTLSDNGNGTSSLQVAFDGQSDGWVAWGIPGSGGGMLGASVMIVQKNAGGEGAVAAPYLLVDYDSDSFKKNSGTLRVSGVRAGASQGRLQTSFTLLMDKPVAELTKAPMTIIYASGPIDDNGKLLPHRGRGFTTELDLSVAVAQPFDRTRTTGRQVRPLSPAPEEPGSDQGRRLLQAFQACPDRTVTLTGPDGTPVTKRYAACQVLDIGDGAYHVLYSVVDNGNGTSTLYGAYTMDTSGWLGFGQPGTAGGMVGGSALIAKPNATSETGADITQYFLGGYNVAKVQPGGNLVLLEKTAEKTPTALTGTFTMLLNQGPTEPLPIIYAFGLVSAAGTILPHQTGNMNSGLLPLSNAVVTAVGEEGAPVPGPLASPAGAPKGSALARLAALTGAATATAPAEAQQPSGEGEVSMDPEEGSEADVYNLDAAGPGLDAAGPGLATAPAASPEQEIVAGVLHLAAAPAGGNASGALAAAAAAVLPQGAPPSTAPTKGGQYTLLFGGQQLVYNQRDSLAPDNSLRIYWTVGGQRRRSLLQQNAARTPVDIALEMQGATGYAGFGLPKVPDQMVGGSAVICKSCPACPTGASVDNYYMEGRDTASVKAGQGDLVVVDMRGEATSDDRLLCTFRLFLPYTGADLDQPIPILAAMGPVSATGALRYHNRFHSGGQLNFASGSALLIKSQSLLPKVHGYIMVISWGFLIPIGALVAGSLRNFDPLWFQIHRAVQSIAYLAAIVGMGIGLYLKEFLGTYEEYVHRMIGITVMVLGFVQVLALVLRPSPEHRYRWLWAGYHQILGVCAMLLAFTNAILGMRNMSVYFGYFVGFTLIWLAIMLSWLLGRWISLRRRKSSGGRLDMRWQHAGANGLMDDSAQELQMGSMRTRR